MGIKHDPFDLDGDGKLDTFEKAYRDSVLAGFAEEDEKKDADDFYDKFDANDIL